MAARSFVILRYSKGVPTMAGCEACQRKFFTLPEVDRDPHTTAEQYLLRKFDQHKCEPETKGRWPHWGQI